LDARAVGEDGAPARKSTDETNCRWCHERGAVLMTHDRGKKDRTILDHLNQHQVHAIFLHDDLRTASTHEAVRAVLNSESHMDQLAAGRYLIRRRLKLSGRLEKR